MLTVPFCSRMVCCTMSSPTPRPEISVRVFFRLKAGRNTHHIIEAVFKAVSRCLRDAVRVEGGGVPSTKGSL